VSKKALGERLIHTNIINIDQLEKAKNEQKNTGAKLVNILLDQGAVDHATMRDQLAEMHGAPGIDLSSFDIDPEALKLMSAEQCRKHTVIPISKAGSSLVVAFSDPSNIFVKDDIAFLTRCKIQPVVALESEIKQAIEKYYQTAMGDSVSEVLTQMEVSDDGGGKGPSIDLDGSDDPVIRFVNMMLVDAIKAGVSDIHVEPYENYLRVRFRKDGQLSEKYRPPMSIAAAFSSRLKVMARLDITEKRRPQDGRIKIRVPGRADPVDFRVSVLPTVGGEKVVMRILDKSNLKLDLRDLGFEEEELAKFLAAIRMPQGLVLVTGPTGSGKTTTLYSALNELHDVTKNISTAEDPVEFNIQGINQTQLNSDIDFNFAEALRSFLRQDPDIILVGEIRDLETAEVAFQASSTGHLVLSTLHTNDATKTVDRLVNMGVPPFLVTSTVELILAQRLVARTCQSCKVEEKITIEALIDAGYPEEEAGEVQCYKGAGCPKCDGKGKTGRVAIYEVMPMSDILRDAVLTGATPTELRKAAIVGGMSSLRRSGLTKVKKGVVSIQEVLSKTMKDPI